jgi:hypothetical protein
MALSLCLVDASAQSRKKKTRRTAKPAAPKPVVTNPPIAPPTEEAGSDVKIISTAEDEAQQSESKPAETKPAAKKKVEGDNQEDMQQTINNLSNQVDKLNDKLGKMQENDREMMDMERLTRAEQRAEGLRSQLLDAETKLADLQSRLDQIEYAIKPENIERATATYGTTRPEEAREARRRQLDNERTRTQSQVRLLETSKTRLEQAIATADNEVDLLRRRLESKQQDTGQAEESGKQKPRKKPN